MVRGSRHPRLHRSRAGPAPCRSAGGELHADDGRRAVRGDRVDRPAARGRADRAEVVGRRRFHQAFNPAKPGSVPAGDPALQPAATADADGTGMSATTRRTSSWAITVLAGGFGDEATFRGVVLQTLLPDGARRAVLVSSVLFGVAYLRVMALDIDPVHVVSQAANSVGMGIAFAALVVVTGTIWPLVLISAASQVVFYHLPAELPSGRDHRGDRTADGSSCCCLRHLAVASPPASAWQLLVNSPLIESHSSSIRRADDVRLPGRCHLGGPGVLLNADQPRFLPGSTARSRPG